MLKPSDETPPPSWEEERDRIIGLGERSFKKSYYPELRSNLSRLERFRTLLDFSGELVVLFSLPDGEIVDANTPADPVFDLPAASLIGKPLALLGLTHSERIVAQLNADAERGETSLHHETLEILPRHAGAEPQQIDVDFRIASVEGTAYGILLARNAAPRLAAEARLRLAARIIERSSEGIVITDADCNIIEVNAAFEKITGFTRERAIGRNPRFFPAAARTWRSIATCGSRSTITVSGRARSGTAARAGKPTPNGC